MATTRGIQTNLVFVRTGRYIASSLYISKIKNPYSTAAVLFQIFCNRHEKIVYNKSTVMTPPQLDARILHQCSPASQVSAANAILIVDVDCINLVSSCPGRWLEYYSLQFGNHSIRIIMSSRPISSWSSLNIGLQKSSEESSSMKRQFREEAHRITKYLEGVHHSQKQSHAQTNYSETVLKLSKVGQEPQVHLKRPPPPKIYSSNRDMVLRRQEDTIAAMNKNTFTEHDLNHRKRAHNREVSRVAVLNSVNNNSFLCCLLEQKTVCSNLLLPNKLLAAILLMTVVYYHSQVLSGTAPMPKDILFPQKASHQSVLTLTGMLACPDARIPPPSVPRRQKWLGGGVGWAPS